MKLESIVHFRRDLLFSGAVQIGWLDENPALAEEAAKHFAFHGPKYHGKSADDSSLALRPTDTATFTRDLLERLTAPVADEPCTLAIAGYGAGKSHLALTLASLLSDPHGRVAEAILSNLGTADPDIGSQARRMVKGLAQPFLVVTLNGMRDFDLGNEIVRRVVAAVRRHGLDTKPLDDLRPRFATAARFTETLYSPFADDFRQAFGKLGVDEIVSLLKGQDEESFAKVSAIHERRLGTPITASGQESLHDVIRVAQQVYCGDGKPFAGIVILFDEFGRYLEFAVQRPHIAGPGALQQLFEAVQANAERVYMLCFIQYELKTYVSRVASELRDDLQRYVTRYDIVRKVRLSSNLETLVANLLEKRDPAVLSRLVPPRESSSALHAELTSWFPEVKRHAVWRDSSTFHHLIVEGCWPLHPLSTWLLFSLSASGQSLQQRSALALMAEALLAHEADDVGTGYALSPVDFCTNALIHEFQASERLGQRGAAALSYGDVMAKFGHQLTADEVCALKATLLLAKTGARVTSRDDFHRAMAAFGGRSFSAICSAVHDLESHHGVLSWNDGLKQYEIISDAIPRARFLAEIDRRVATISADERAQLFMTRFKHWNPNLDTIATDFGVSHQIVGKEWNYTVGATNVSRLRYQIDLAIRTWQDAVGIDTPKGQLLYCYLGPDSDPALVRSQTESYLRKALGNAGHSWEVGAPIAIALIHDRDGALGARIAEESMLASLTNEEQRLYRAYIPDRQSSIAQELSQRFQELERTAVLVCATARTIERSLPLRAALTGLFEAVYDRILPFPFDGYTTSRGNAAEHCAQVTRQLALRQLDREWIAAQPPALKNRAAGLLDRSWQALDGAGKVRPLPANLSVRRVIEQLEAQLTGNGASSGLNLGSALSDLLKPPYGCSLPCAGLLLALLMQAQGEACALRYGGRPITSERWLPEALSHHTFERSVLDQTVLIPVSGVERNEWQRLLNEWDIEPTYQGRVDYQRKADELSRRLPVPPDMHYRYENLVIRATEARARLSTHDQQLDDANTKLVSGSASSDVNLLAWSGSILVKCKDEMQAERERWTMEQFAEVEKSEAQARTAVKTLFSAWLPRQRPDSLRRAEDWVRQMKRMESNLEDLELFDEQRDLKHHREQVEDHFRFVEEVAQLARDVENWLASLELSESTTVRLIETTLDRLRQFRTKVKGAEGRNLAATRERLREVAAKLDECERRCQELRAKINARGAAICRRVIKTPDDIKATLSEVERLRILYDGDDDQVSYLDDIRMQLDRVLRDYQELENSRLDIAQFDEALRRRQEETEEAFEEGAVLDNEAIYKGIGETIRAKRRKRAEEWMSDRTVLVRQIRSSDAYAVRNIQKMLQDAPPWLDDAQSAQVQTWLAECDRRLDALEVEGLVTRYLELSLEGRQRFLKRIGATAVSVSGPFGDSADARR